MQEKELKKYEEIGNWDFSDIQYIVEQESFWDFYKEIAKYSNKNSLLLDLGTGGGEKVLSLMPEAGMIIATDFSSKMIETANKNKENFPNKNIKFVTMDNLNMKFPNNLFDIVTARSKVGMAITETMPLSDPQCCQLKKIMKKSTNNKKDLI